MEITNQRNVFRVWNPGKTEISKPSYAYTILFTYRERKKAMTSDNKIDKISPNTISFLVPQEN